MSAKDYRLVASIAVFAPLAISLAISLGAMELFSVLSVLWGGVIFLKFRPVFADNAAKRNFLTTMFRRTFGEIRHRYRTAKGSV